ncbi:MAG: hypothetical protein P9X22_02705 [Candidatus Zapsychrus exili]|nr:hypothetical protein [Candidatus Zapsychrus exili]
MLKNLKNNENGVVFIMVIAIIMVMMVLVISVLSMNTSQVISTEDEVRRIQAETLAMGALDYSFELAENSTLGTGPLYNETIDGTVFSVSTDFSSSDLDIDVDY